MSHFSSFRSWSTLPRVPLCPAPLCPPPGHLTCHHTCHLTCHLTPGWGTPGSPWSRCPWTWPGSSQCSARLSGGHQRTRTHWSGKEEDKQKIWSELSHFQDPDRDRALQWRQICLVRWITSSIFICRLKENCDKYKIVCVILLSLNILENRPFFCRQTSFILWTFNKVLQTSRV